MKKTIITFEEFEQAVMQKMLEEETAMNTALREQYRRAHIESREFTGVGFFTNFKIPDDAPRVLNFTDYGYGDVIVNINNHHDFGGFVIFIQDGIMLCLEGYTFTESWPEVIKSYKLYR